MVEPRSGISTATPRPVELVGALAADLDGGGRRAPAARPRLRARRSRASVAIARLLDDLALPVAGRRAQPEADLGAVALVQADEVAREPGPASRAGRAGARSRAGRACPRALPSPRSVGAASATTANEDGPAGLSTSTRPDVVCAPTGRQSRRRPWSARVGRLLEELAADEVDDLLRRGLAREPGGLTVAAAAALAGDGGDVDALRAGAQADAPRGAVLRRRLADEGDDLGALDRAQEVDDALGERLLRPGGGEVAALEVGDDDAAALVDLRLVERAREQLELREGDVLVDVLEDPVDVGAGLDEVRPPSAGPSGWCSRTGSAPCR